jgi:hypothetical protein
MPKEQSKSSPLLDSLIQDVKAIKEKLSAREDFLSDATAREAFAILLTVEGAMLFRDTAEFAEICVQFCKKKEMDLVFAN